LNLNDGFLIRGFHLVGKCFRMRSFGGFLRTPIP